MPRFDPDSSGTITSHFGFSAVDLSTLGASEYTLVGLAVDCSGSVSSFARDEERAIGEVVQACLRSPRADNLLLRYVTFDDRLDEVHGFKLLRQCAPADYANTIRSGGMTALFDAAVDGVDALARQGKELVDNDFSVNGVLFVITDGNNNAGLHRSAGSIQQAIVQARRAEHLESIVTVLIGVNVADATIRQYLDDVNREGGFTQFVNLEDASAKSLAKLAAFVSKSISSVSQSLGTGGPSTHLPTI